MEMIGGVLILIGVVVMVTAMPEMRRLCAQAAPEGGEKGLRPQLLWSVQVVAAASGAAAGLAAIIGAVPMSAVTGALLGVALAASGAVARGLAEQSRRARTRLLMQRDEGGAGDVARTRSMFMQNMSHELRTPLNVIIGYAELLVEELEETRPELAPDAENIRVSGRRLLEIVDSVLDLSRIETGAMSLDFEPFDWAALIAEVEAAIAPVMEARGNRFEITGADDIRTVQGDRHRFQQVLHHLLHNAAKFTEGGRVTLHIEPFLKGEVAWLRLRVSDTGIGIPPEHQEVIFDAFAQVESAYDRRFEGTGLGLTLSRRLCQMMGGDVTLESEPGVGSTFTATMPAGYIERG